ncbi:DUF4333 domain-containing protein [Amycolatopsis lurida]
MTQPPNQPGQWWQPGAPQPDPQQQQWGQQGQWPQQQPAPPQYGGYPQQQPGYPPSGPQPAQQQPPQPQQWGQQQPQGYPAQPQQQPPAQEQQQQYGGGFQPSASQYGGLGAFGDGAENKKKSKKPLIIGGVAVLVLAAGGAAAWFGGLFSGDVLDPSSVQSGITTVLKDSYGEQDVQNAKCPDSQEIKTGHTFDCDVNVAGQPKKVTIRVLNDKPEFEVGAPK